MAEPCRPQLDIMSLPPFPNHSRSEWRWISLNDCGRWRIIRHIWHRQSRANRWIAEGATNAFLALPGPDGLVHNGKELFGNFSPQPSSDHPNGFAALAVYDDPKNGGNGDGIIDNRDAIFSSLRLWIDENHDGICQPEELHSLPSLGVDSISVRYHPSERQDQYGNWFHYVANVNGHDSRNTPVGHKAYDVFFVQE